MERYINANKLSENLRHMAKYQEPNKQNTILGVVSTIKNTPAEDVEKVIHGKWVRRQKIYGIGYEYVCSVCEKGIRHYEGQPICSECGAKMDGDK